MLCQNKVKLKYLDLDGREISYNEFQKIDTRRYFVAESRNDSIIFKKIYPRKNSSQLDSIQQIQMTMFLKKIIGIDFDEEKNTMIHLYDTDEKLQKALKHSAYWQWIEKNKKEYQSFLIGTKTSNIKIDPENHTYLDDYNMLKNLFFKNSEFDINHLFIKPTGEIYFYYGIDEILFVLDWSV